MNGGGGRREPAATRLGRLSDAVTCVAIRASRCRWVAVAIVLWLLVSAAEAQEARRPFRIGVLNAAWAASHPTVEGLKAGLKARGLEDGRDVTFDIRFTEGKLDAMPAAAAALVKAGVDLIFTSQEAATLAAKDATTSVPIVFTLVGDPVGRRHRQQRSPSPAAT